MRRLRRTKIVATIGPACRSPEKLAELINAGADLFRLNMAHAGPAVQTETLAMIRQVSRDLGQPIAVLADLAGPKIRLGELPGGAIECEMNAEFRFVRGHEARASDQLVTTYDPLVDELKNGDVIELAGTQMQFIHR